MLSRYTVNVVLAAVALSPLLGYLMYSMGKIFYILGGYAGHGDTSILGQVDAEFFSQFLNL